MARVLIVEDEFVISKFYEVLLTKENHQVVGVAKKISEAKNFLEKENIDVVILDLRLKNGEYGLDLLDETSKRKVPVVVVTGNDDPKTREELEKKGVQYILSKPVNPKNLFDLIKKLQENKYE